MAIIVLILAALLSIALGLSVVASQPKRFMSWSFLLVMLSTSLWAFGIGMFIVSTDAGMLRAWSQLYYVAALMIAPSMLITAIDLARVRSWRNITSVMLPGVLFAGLILARPDLLIESVVVGSQNSVNLGYPMYFFYIVYFVSNFSLALIVSLIGYKNPRLKNRQPQIKLFMIAYIAAGWVGMIFNLFLPAFGIYYLIWLGPLCMFIFVPVVYVSIVRYGLFDIRRATMISSVYILSLAVLGAVYYFLAYAVSWIVIRPGDNFAVSVSPANMLIALLLAFAFQPIRQFFDRITSSIFYHENYDTEEFFARFNHLMVSAIDLRELLDLTSVEIMETLKPEMVLLFTTYAQSRNVSIASKGQVALSASEVARFSRIIDDSSHGLIYTRDVVGNEELKSVLEKRKIAILLPLRRNNQTIGYLALGERRSGNYSSQDLTALEAVADSLVISIQNAVSVQEIKDFNITLQARVAEATKELRESNDKLKKLDETKDEFISMASHQLRTPLTSVKGYISMVLEGDAGKVSDDQRRLLREAFDSSERMVHLIGDFLNVSRLQTGKFVIDKSAVNLADLVEQEIFGLASTAEAHNLKLKFRKPAHFPTLYIDEGKVRQVIMNFIDNAIYYSPGRSSIDIELSQEDGDAVLRVSDTGIGVPKQVQSQLFTKFFRADNAKRQRPDGTGIGLYLAKKVINSQHGRMIFESVEGKGSTFGFRLPIEKLSIPPSQEET